MKDRNVRERYDRQNLIDGWDQSKLSNARVALLGSGQLANFTVASLVPLGVGNVEIYDSTKVDGRGEFLLFSAKKGEPKTHALERILSEINPSSRIKGLDMSPARDSTFSVIGSPKLIIDLTNSGESKEKAVNYCAVNGIPFMSASASEVGAEMSFVKLDKKELTLVDHTEREQGVLPSMVMGGIIAEEVRKLIMPRSKAERVARKISYCSSSDSRFSLDDEVAPRAYDFTDKKALIIGAGALGNFVSLGLALSGVGNIDILDFDKVEATNLNRQLLFWDSVGKKKSRALANRISEINPSINVRGIDSKLTEKSKYFSRNKPDVILDCVDSLAVRAITNYFGIRKEIPIVSGGTSPVSGQVVVYEPGKSACLDCKIGVEKALAEERSAMSCIFAPDPSVVMTNQIVGGMMVSEAMNVLGRAYAEPVTRVLKYDSRIDARGGLVGPQDPCACEKPGVNEWIKSVMEKAEEVAA